MEWEWKRGLETVDGRGVGGQCKDDSAALLWMPWLERAR
jgi:hypothetical protein